MEKKKSLGLTRTHFSEEENGMKRHVRLISSDGDIFEAANRILKTTLVTCAQIAWDYEIRSTSILDGSIPEETSCFEIKSLSNDAEESFSYFFVATTENAQRMVDVIQSFDSDAKVEWK